MYGYILSHIFVKEGIDCSLDVGLHLSSPINLKSLKKSDWEFVETEWKRKRKRGVDEEEDVLRDVDDLVNLITDEHHTNTDAARTLPEADLPPHFRMLLHSIDMRLTTMQSELDGRLTQIETKLREIRSDLNAGFKGPPPEN
ncbi:hypothetical protein V6N11_058370 [Hibiscus sabdariffa]|uniref:Uncharacterized protein n=1 Tax=Hibiscus sabdariffa TaxID=183260 RepID=A0ABR2U444_9ROSI